MYRPHESSLSRFRPGKSPLRAESTHEQGRVYDTATFPEPGEDSLYLDREYKSSIRKSSQTNQKPPASSFLTFTQRNRDSYREVFGENTNEEPVYSQQKVCETRYFVQDDSPRTVNEMDYASSVSQRRDSGISESAAEGRSHHQKIAPASIKKSADSRPHSQEREEELSQRTVSSTKKQEIQNLAEESFSVNLENTMDAKSLKFTLESPWNRSQVSEDHQNSLVGVPQEENSGRIPLLQLQVNDIRNGAILNREGNSQKVYSRGEYEAPRFGKSANQPTQTKRGTTPNREFSSRRYVVEKSSQALQRPQKPFDASALSLTVEPKIDLDTSDTSTRGRCRERSDNSRELSRSQHKPNPNEQSKAYNDENSLIHTPKSQKSVSTTHSSENSSLLSQVLCERHKRPISAVTISSSADRRLLCIYCLSEKFYPESLDINDCLTKKAIINLSQSLLAFQRPEEIIKRSSISEVLTAIDDTIDLFVEKLRNIKLALREKVVQGSMNATKRLLNFDEATYYIQHLVKLLDTIDIQQSKRCEPQLNEYCANFRKLLQINQHVEQIHTQWAEMLKKDVQAFLNNLGNMSSVLHQKADQILKSGEGPGIQFEPPEELQQLQQQQQHQKQLQQQQQHQKQLQQQQQHQKQLQQQQQQQNTILEKPFRAQSTFQSECRNAKESILTKLKRCETLQTRRIPQATQTSITALALAPDGSCVASGCTEGHISIWSLPEKTLCRQIAKAHLDKVVRMEILPSHNLLVSSSTEKDNSLRVWDLENATPIYSFLQTHEGGLLTFSLSDDAKFIFSGGQDGYIKYWDIDSKILNKYVANAHDGGVSSLAYHSKTNKLATGSIDRDIRIWDVSELSLHLNLSNAHEQRIVGIAFSANGAVLFSCAEDGEVKMWDLELRVSVAKMRSPQAGKLRELKLPALGEFFLTGAEDKTIAVWRIDPNQKLKCMVLFEEIRNEETVNLIAISNVNDYIVSAAGSDIIFLES